ncbi:NAD(P)H-dependent flavin oxidoreductase [Salinicola aestuarinus]|uniref:NAD(P)H-dependent flavin oxidoreductase n=1 Tax=Salinicola aestuarinus TaxID=1949082 RepID=UPI000DA20A11|nr:nitronate monooxygenase [Salinicola aestuarinus]
MHLERPDPLYPTIPLYQAPMAGVSTPAMAAAVSNAGGLGGLGLGAMSPNAARDTILETQALTRRAFNVNLFCHAPAVRNERLEADWIERSRELFAAFGAAPPARLEEIYTPFTANDAMLDVLLQTRPAVVSFHFGLPRPGQIRALRDAGCRLIATATSLEEARRIEASGLDAVIVQGWSAGGHRGVFDPRAHDDKLSTEALTRLLAHEISLPVIAAGGLMDGRDVTRALSWGAIAAQLGTAFVACPESAADDAYRERLLEGGETRMTTAISGRPARCLTNRFTAWSEGIPAEDVPAYPCTYALAKALHAAARNQGEFGYGAQWAGTQAAKARAMPAQALTLEIEAARYR